MINESKIYQVLLLLFIITQSLYYTKNYRC